MTGVGNKALLFFIAFRNRTDESADKEAYQNGDHSVADQRHHDTGYQKFAVQIELAAAVEEGDPRTAGLGGDDVAVALHKALVAAAAQRFFGILNGGNRVNSIDPAGFGRDDIARGVDIDRKEPAFKRDFRRHIGWEPVVKSVVE